MPKIILTPEQEKLIRLMTLYKFSNQEIADKIGVPLWRIYNFRKSTRGKKMLS